MDRSTTAAALVALAIMAAACGGADAASKGAPPDGTDPAAGACLEGTPDCVDTDLDGDGAAAPGDDGTVDEDGMIRDAESLLGQSEEEVLAVWGDVRVGRRGDEHMMLTEDYVIGRKTIATEDDGTGTFRVVEVTVELTEGPHLVKRPG